MPRQSTSLPLMLYLEWILLGTVLANTIVIGLLDTYHQFPFLTILCLGGLAVLGFITKNIRFHKLWLTPAEFGLILLPIFAGDHLPTFPVLGIVLVSRSTQRFNLLGRLIVAAGAYISFILTMFFWQGPYAISFSQVFDKAHIISRSAFNVLIVQLNAIFHYGMMLSFVFLLFNSLMSERQSREHLSFALTKLRQYSLRIEEQATLQERNRIAREMHDSLGHTLTAQSIQLDSAILLLNSGKIEQAVTFFNNAKLLCAQALEEVRHSVSMLRSDCLLGNSLEVAIFTLIDDFQSTTTINLDCTIRLTQTLSPELNSTVYRILQAGLTNIVRHSAATEATLHLTIHSGTLYLLIKDNGRGFDPEQNLTGFGLQGMRERARALNGQFNLFTEPGSGCLITVQIPLSRSLP